MPKRCDGLGPDWPVQRYELPRVSTEVSYEVCYTHTEKAGHESFACWRTLDCGQQKEAVCAICSY